MVAPPFGTASAYTDSFPNAPPNNLTIPAETCFQLNIFKGALHNRRHSAPVLTPETVKQYRKLDDQIITRLNRAQAQLRDLSRSAKTVSADQGTDGMCTRLWTEMMGWLILHLGPGSFG